jgi:hypothetical protein
MTVAPHFRPFPPHTQNPPSSLGLNDTIPSITLARFASPVAAVSPFRQRALKGTLHGYIFNGYSRAMRQAPYMLIPFGIGT